MLVFISAALANERDTRFAFFSKYGVITAADWGISPLVNVCIFLGQEAKLLVAYALW